MKRTPKAAKGGQKISDLLRTLPQSFKGSTITVEDLKEALSGRTYGVLLLVLALPNLLPIPAPGLSAALGLPLFLVTLQWMVGRESPWFPRFVARRKMKTAQLKRIFTRAIPYVSKLEWLLKPRLQFFTKPPASYAIAFICVGLSILIMLPIPFGNALPALAICFFALALIQHDGLFVIFGLIAALCSFALISAFSEAVSLIFSIFE